MVDVVERLHDPTDPSTERTAPPCSTHVQHDDVPRALDPVEGRGRVPSARQRGDGDDEFTGAGLRTRLRDCLLCFGVPPGHIYKGGGREAGGQEGRDNPQV